jgi:hypothetical protein
MLTQDFGWLIDLIHWKPPMELKNTLELDRDHLPCTPNAKIHAQPVFCGKLVGRPDTALLSKTHVARRFWDCVGGLRSCSVYNIYGWLIKASCSILTLSCQKWLALAFTYVPPEQGVLDAPRLQSSLIACTQVQSSWS